MYVNSAEPFYAPPMSKLAKHLASDHILSCGCHSFNAVVGFYSFYAVGRVADDMSC